LLATGVVAALFQPLRARLQRGVDRLLYGVPVDPYQEISRLGGQLEETQADLQRSRERLVTAREEERRRLRRDLHDGLGPALASFPLKLDAAGNLLARDPAAADALLAGLKAQTLAAVADIRRLVYALRPPALDDLGLVGALRADAAQHDPTGLRVTVEAPESLPPLP